MRLTHLSGYTIDKKIYPEMKTRWGYDPGQPNRFTVVILKDNKLWYPDALKSNTFHDVKGFKESDELFFFKKSANLTEGMVICFLFREDLHKLGLSIFVTTRVKTYTLSSYKNIF